MQVVKIKKRQGIAGQYQLDATVEYPGESPRVVGFVGSVYGGPVVMISGSMGGQTIVTDPGRFGVFGVDWVRRFFDAA